MMNIETSTAIFIDDDATVTVAQLALRSGLSEAELQALVDCGALAPREAEPQPLRFGARAIVTARAARRLRDDFALDDAHAVAVLLRFLQRIDSLERELRALQADR